MLIEKELYIFLNFCVKSTLVNRNFNGHWETQGGMVSGVLLRSGRGQERCLRRAHTSVRFPMANVCAARIGRRRTVRIAARRQISSEPQKCMRMLCVCCKLYLDQTRGVSRRQSSRRCFKPLSLVT